MQFIEALRLRSKLFFLFFLITVGLFSIGIMGAININDMKKNLDGLYFGSLVPVTELNEMLQTYHNGLASTLYRVKNNQISVQETSSELEYSLTKINKLWKSYESHFKRDEELQYVEYVALEIKVVNRYFLKLLRVARSGRDMSAISIGSLEKYVSHIHTVLQKLIHYEVKMARYDRKKFLQIYDMAILKLGIILGLIILAILIISYSVFSSIQSDQTRLEIVTKKLRKLNKKLENVSYTDSLTGMHNRRYFNMVYERELKRARRTHSHITFMMLDIDYFKQYNDTYGHIQGDNALQAVAKVLVNTLQRPSDFVFRLGGEEFGALITQTDESNSAKLARDIGDAIREQKIEHSGSTVNNFLTISIGVVCCIADDALNEDILISRADEMLYEAKDTGRDRYIITSNVSESTTHHVADLTA
ncbi:MAG: diguanylate cyclase (GGDEF)-like protein [Sulfurimonas sp.]|jgi:diguanylate cyclase (GGDEF)-like protein|uniref:diguanylate cyclase n=1 Tax=Sulfurimonas sp. TaxID=2022749 RepID=UPI0039E343E9